MASSYENDLRLNEVATGDASGTWGTVTNLNLELIGEALGYGTEAITTNADTFTSTVAPGATDPVRSMYIKYTGTLDSTCTITIEPNTMCRVHFIENATSGSQSIIISQGSGANVTIPNGYVKAVYLDGAGSGAAVTEAFDNLSVGTNFRIGNAAAEDTAIIFDGNAQDFYIGLDDSADDLIIGLGSTVGTTPIISVDENKDVAIPDGSLTITTGDNSAALTLKSTDTDASIGPILDLARDNSSAADGDVTGTIRFVADDDGNNQTTYVQLVSKIVDASDTTEDGSFHIESVVAGSTAQRMDVLAAETVFNEGSADIDFRVESNGNANMVFVDAGNDAVSIGHGSTIAIAGERHELQVYDTNFSTISAATFRAGSDGASISLAHSRSGTIGTQTILQDGDTMGAINFLGSDGTDMASYGARIWCEVDGTPGSNDMPGRLIFATTADGGTGSSEHMRLDSTGVLELKAGPTSYSQSSSENSFIYHDNSGNTSLKLGTNYEVDGSATKIMNRTTTIANFYGNGNVEIADGDLVIGTSGHGIDFSATANSSGNLGSEVLSDYEDGTWTPVLIAGTTNPTGGSAQSPSGRYTKVGNRVTVTFFVGRSWTNSPAGGIYISGLPYTVHSSTNDFYTGACATYNVAFGDSVFIGPNASQTTLQLYAGSSGGAWGALTWTTHTSGTIIYISGEVSYHV